jgi:exopolyphosphatase/guanosine-5'-triphosphate,3'-diphosphate pyrophosphatase
MQKARFAAIDVGSNALRLRIVEASGPRDLRDVYATRVPVRLGREVFVTRRLSPTALADGCRALRAFREAMDEHRVVAYRAVATSAVREAVNGATLVERARREAGVELELIEGVEEARLVQLAVGRAMKLERPALLVDVGGGSTEITRVDRGKTTFSVSLPLGTVRLLETYLAGASALDRATFALMGEAIDRTLAEALPDLLRQRVGIIIGTGGNIEALAELCPAGARRVDVNAMDAAAARLAAMAPSARERTYGLRPDRADTIVPAAAIFLRLARALEVAKIAAPGVGVKDGVLAELIDRHFRVWDAGAHAAVVLDACRRLGDRLRYDEAHAERVAHFASRLFDDLASVHRLGARERLLLVAGALLHDVGDFVRYDGHHKHGYYLVLHSDIMGLSPDERAIVANLVRYHRKSTPDLAHPNFRELPKEARATVRALAAILRIADALDREHKGKVWDVRASAGKARVRLKVEGADDRELEEWTVLHKAELFREVFALEVVLVSGAASSVRIPAAAPAA